MTIAEMLPTGEQNAVPLRDLINITGMSGRTVRRMIEAERISGAPICSGCGYYMPATEDEKARFVRSMRRRAHEIMFVASQVEGVKL